MKTSIRLCLLAVLLAGCASGPPFIDQIQPEAVNMAVRRGQFELNCPTATGQMLSRETLQPLVQTFRFTGPQRAEYTVGVEDAVSARRMLSFAQTTDPAVALPGQVGWVAADGLSLRLDQRTELTKVECSIRCDVVMEEQT